jgi:hypothetical protein
MITTGARMTKEDNARARLLYDKLAGFGGDYSL